MRSERVPPSLRRPADLLYLESRSRADFSTGERRPQVDGETHAMSSTKRPILDGTMLRQRLAALRRRLRLVASVRGTGCCSRLCWPRSSSPACSTGDGTCRPWCGAVVLVGTLVAGIFVAFRYLFVP